MSEYMLVVEGLAESGADAAMFVNETDYKAAMFGCAFNEPVHGYVWCALHGWVLADETCVCEDCATEQRQLDYENAYLLDDEDEEIEIIELNGEDSAYAYGNARLHAELDAEAEWFRFMCRQ